MSENRPSKSSATPDAIRSQSIVFQNENKAIAVFPSSEAKADDILAALGLKPYKAAILILGATSIEDDLVPRLTQLFGRGIARAAADASAVIIDTGTQSGVAALMGEGVGGRGYKSELIGVAPSSLVTYPGNPEDGGTQQLEPNHSHFVLVTGNSWGAETSAIYNLFKRLTSKTPGMAIITGGGPASRNEVLRVVRENLPLIVVEGSGGLADEIASAWKQRPNLPDEPVMAEIIADGKIHLHLLSKSVKTIERLIIQELGGDYVLKQVWEDFADYDASASLQQKRFNRLQLAILIIGVLGTALAVTQAVFGPRDMPPPLPLGWWIVKHLLIMTPILLTVLVTAASRFKQGNKWLLLRAAAEAIKREIYRYRARAMHYNGDPTQPSPEQQLAKRVEDVTRRTMQTEVNISALTRYDKAKGFPPYMYAALGGDDGFSYLTPDRYVEVRLGDQLNYFRKSIGKHEWKLKVLYWLTFVIGGVGTYLAAIGRAEWIALTTAIVAAMGTYLSYRQTESTIMKYNQAATDLANIKSWWMALSAEEQSSQDNIDLLVEHTEQVLESELNGWIQQLQNALSELRKGSDSEPAEKKNDYDQEPDAGAKTSKSGKSAATAGAGREAAVPTKPPDGREPKATDGSGKEKGEPAINK